MIVLARVGEVIELDAICCDALVWKWPVSEVAPTKRTSIGGVAYRTNFAHVEFSHFDP
jgi:hypothetical protein